MEMAEALKRYNRIAIVGLSPDASRPSHGVATYLMRVGYQVDPIRPGGGEILGRRCLASLHELPQPPEIVDVFRASEHVPAIVDEAIATGAKVLWLQEGVTHPEAERRARDAGLAVFSNLCILKEHLRMRREGA